MRLELSNKIEIKNGSAHYTGAIINGDQTKDISGSIKLLQTQDETIARIVFRAQAELALYKKQLDTDKFWYVPVNHIFKRREDENS